DCPKWVHWIGGIVLVLGIARGIEASSPFAIFMGVKMAAFYWAVCYLIVLPSLRKKRKLRKRALQEEESRWIASPDMPLEELAKLNKSKDRSSSQP
ncbi:MAG: hypothetical protein KDB07_12135, partial [Planctomycetes bacterium]|nr:hypothetical protein [Planctomycetota bacterium]